MLKRALIPLGLSLGCGIGIGGAVEESPGSRFGYPTFTVHISDAWGAGYGSFFARNVSKRPLLVGLDFYASTPRLLKTPIPTLHPGLGLGVMADHSGDTTYIRGLGGFLGLELLFAKHYNPNAKGFDRFRAMYLRGYIFGHTLGPGAGFGAELGFRMSTEPSI